MRRLYFDNNARTQPAEQVLREVLRVSQTAYANPGSRHAHGRQAKDELDQARATVARCLGAQPDQVIFTSGGTESITQAFMGFADRVLGDLPGHVPNPAEENALSRLRIALQPGEHPATEFAAGRLQRLGWQPLTLNLNSQGQLDGTVTDRRSGQRVAVLDYPWGERDVLTVLLAHNETGVVQDATSLAGLARSLRSRHNVWLHVDAVQAVGKIDVNFRELGVSALSIAGHKFCATQGVGALLVSDPNRLGPLLGGGGQERGLRAGTECPALAAGLACALDLWQQERHARLGLAQLRDRLESNLQERLQSEGIRLVVHGQGASRLPGTSFVSFPDFAGVDLVGQFDQQGISCSAGAACKSGTSGGSPILAAMGNAPDVCQSAIRFSLGRETQVQDVDELVERVGQTLHSIQTASPRS